MDNTIPHHLNGTDGSAAASPYKKYSAKELGEMMNNCPDQLFCIDIAACTDYYTNNDYMEEMLSYVEDEKRIDGLIEIILIRQEYQTFAEHHPKVCYRVTDNRKYVPYVEDLKEILCGMRIRVLHAREVEAKMAALRKQWSSISSSPTCPAVTDSIKTETLPPRFPDDSTTDTREYHLAELPQEVQKNILIEEKKYSVFVKTLRRPVKQWIDKHRLQDWNVVRFVCRLRGILTKHCSMRVFGTLLEHIGLENQENNMKQRKDANDKNALTAYDDPKDNKYWKLRKDGKAVEELLADFINEEAA